MLERVQEYRQLVDIFSIFLIVQFAGLLLVFYSEPIPSQVAVQAASVQMQTGAVFTALEFIAAILVGTAVIIILFKLSRGNLLFRLIEGYVIVGGTFYFVVALLGTVVQQAGIVLAAGLVIGLLLAIAKNRWPGLRNFTVIIASIGVGIALGTAFGPYGFITAYVFMGILSIYDYISVFVTKHMVYLAKEVVTRNLAFIVGSYSVELFPKSYLNAKELEEFRKSVKPNSIKDARIKQLVKEGIIPVPSFHALGAGDLVAPLMLAVSAYGTFLSYFTAISIAIAAVIGLLANMLVLVKYKTILPAMPPIFAFASIAVGIEYWIANPSEWMSFVLLVSTGVIMLALWLFTARRQKKKSLL